MVSVPTVRLSFGGVLPGSEIWQCSLRLDAQVGGVPTQADLDSWASAARAQVAAYLGGTTTKAALGNGVVANFVKAYYIPANSTVSSKVSDGGTYTVNGSGTVGSPNQVAVVVSLRSSNPGRHGRGRYYLPALALAYSSAGTFSGPTATGLATEAATFISNLNAIALEDWTVMAGTIPGLYATQVVVDNVADTQRRRRNGVLATTKAVQAVPGIG